MLEEIKLQDAFYVQNISSQCHIQKSSIRFPLLPRLLPLHAHESLWTFIAVLQTWCLPVAVICHESPSSSVGQRYDAYNSSIEDINFVNPIVPPTDE